MFDFLLKPRRALFLLLLSLILTGIWLFFIWPDPFSWMGYGAVTSDTAQHVSGWYDFVNQPWGFPLLKTSLLDYPSGTNISLTDSLPLFALLFKLFRSVLPANFNYFSLFFMFCYLTQAMAAATLAMSLNQKNVLAVLTLTLFALSMPIVSIRVGVTDSLACQSFILFALGLYFFNHFRRLSLFKMHLYFGLVIGLSLLIHPYITAMSYPFYLASLYEYKKNNPSATGLLRAFLLMNVAIGLECLLCGLGSGAQGAGGFGQLTMNLLAPVNGGVFDTRSWIGPAQGEGFAYLGLGLIIMIVFALVLTKNRFKAAAQQYRPLLMVGLFFFIYAIYGSIYLGTIKIIQWGAPHFFLTYAFRTNGRFFWPCSYILLGFAVATLLAKIPRKACLILPMLIALQLFDTSGYTKGVKSILESNMQPFSEQQKLILKLIQQSKMVIFYPKMHCPGFDIPAYILLIQTQLLSAREQVPFNTVYAAHVDNPGSCTDQAGQFKALTPQLLVANQTLPSPTMQMLLRTAPQDCQITGGAYYCLFNVIK